MAIYNKDSRLSEVLLSNPSLIPVVNRLGVKLGVGDKSIGEVCDIHNLDTIFFLSIINTFVDEEYFPVNPSSVFTLDKTIDYLQKTGDFYLYVQLPNIERHFMGLIQRSGKNNNLAHLLGFYNEMKKQLEESLKFEKEILFPKLLKREMVEVSHSRLLEVNFDVEEKLQDLLTFFVVHLYGEYDRNLCMGVISAIFSLHKDIDQNNRIRTRILYPLIESIADKNLK